MNIKTCYSNILYINELINEYIFFMNMNYNHPDHPHCNNSESDVPKFRRMVTDIKVNALLVL